MTAADWIGIFIIIFFYTALLLFCKNLLNDLRSGDITAAQPEELKKNWEKLQKERLL